MYIRSKGYGVRLHTDGKPAQVRDTGFNVRDFSAQPAEATDRRVASQSRNPRIIVRCIAACADRVLLCARADEPRRGRWNMPGGFLEIGEEPHSAVIREAAEEAGAAIVPLRLAFVHEFPQLNEVVLTYLAEAPEKRLKPGTESLDARFFDRDAIPWRELAFPTDSDALRLYIGNAPSPCESPLLVECFWGSDGRILARQTKK
jgi:ADP-ribose pyrophosphatase YjhB (NUDIX family)